MTYRYEATITYPAFRTVDGVVQARSVETARTLARESAARKLNCLTSLVSVKVLVEA